MYSAIYSIRGIGVVLKWPKRPIFSFVIIKCIKIKHLFAKMFGRCTDIWTFNSECYRMRKSAQIKIFELLWLQNDLMFKGQCHVFWSILSNIGPKLKGSTILAKYSSEVSWDWSNNSISFRAFWTRNFEICPKENWKLCRSFF